MDEGLTGSQRHIMKFILLRTLHTDVYQKDIEEEFRIRKSTVTGILKLLEKNGFIRRESVPQDARLKRIVPTARAEALRPQILEQLGRTEALLMEGIPEEWHGKKVPEVLMSGHHANIEKWRREQSVYRTAKRRPDLLKKADLTNKEWNYVRQLRKQWKEEEEQTK